MWTLKKVEKETIPACQHCGTRIKWVCWIESDAGELLAVGRDCCGNFLSKTDCKKISIEIEVLQRVEKLRPRVEKFLQNYSASRVYDWLACRIGHEHARKHFPELV